MDAIGIPGPEEVLWTEPLNEMELTLSQLRGLHQRHPESLLAVRTHFPRVDYEPLMQIGSEIEQTVLIDAGIYAPGPSWLDEAERESVRTHWKTSTGRDVFRIPPTRF